MTEEECELVLWKIAAEVGMRADRVRGGPVQDGHGLPQVDEADRGRQVAAAGGVEEEYGRVQACMFCLTH